MSFSATFGLPGKWYKPVDVQRLHLLVGGPNAPVSDADGDGGHVVAEKLPKWSSRKAKTTWSLASRSVLLSAGVASSIRRRQMSKGGESSSEAAVPPAKKILVFGATGVIGKVITAALINAKAEFARIGIFTSEATFAGKAALIDAICEGGVDVIVGDVNNDAQVLNAYQAFDTVVSAVGRNAIDKQMNLIRLAESSSTITRFIPSEYGTDIEYNASSAEERPHQKKLQVRAYIWSSVSRMRYTYLVTGPFADMYMGPMAHEPRAGTFDVVNRKATLLGDGTGKISLTTMADVGRLLIAVLLHPEASDNRALKVSSYTTTPNEILAEFERQTGSKWDVSYTPLGDLRGLENNAWQEGSPVATVFTLRRIWTEGSTLYEKTDNAALGMAKMDTLEMSVQETIWKAHG
ncbi:Uu.00g012790.m01.CDS01 [Anthostomella pinea]|uniref:Uu.00g012790.m01.CDS01 n=1 Tax=Anthostomella pinea TaxID=933095 RepID=A0AAI8YQ92_9PEZI|nr:Uu.00g012790.m01.CDS01 [Anthostomella pinea]